MLQCLGCCCGCSYLFPVDFLAALWSWYGISFDFHVYYNSKLFLMAGHHFGYLISWFPLPLLPAGCCDNALGMLKDYSFLGNSRCCTPRNVTRQGFSCLFSLILFMNYIGNDCSTISNVLSPVQLKLCKGISYAAVAAHADKNNRRKLAAMLIEHEPRPSKQVGMALQLFLCL